LICMKRHSLFSQDSSWRGQQHLEDELFLIFLTLITFQIQIQRSQKMFAVSIHLKIGSHGVSRVVMEVILITSSIGSS